MTNDEQIAALENTLATVENGIAVIETQLQNPQSAGAAAGLTATLANLRAQRTTLQLRIAKLRAAGVTVAPVGALGAVAAAAAPPQPKTVLAFAKHVERFAKATLDVVGAEPAKAKRPAKKAAAKRPAPRTRSAGATKSKASKKR